MAWTPYPTPAFNYVTDLFTYANTVTGNLFGTVTLFTVFTILFVSMKRYQTPQAFVSASFLTTLTAFLLFVLDLIGTYIVLIPVVMTLGGMFLLARDR